jgi:cytochrome bd-type quinol oxidase subunit 1
MHSRAAVRELLVEHKPEVDASLCSTAAPSSSDISLSPPQASIDDLEPLPKELHVDPGALPVAEPSRASHEIPRSQSSCLDFNRMMFIMVLSVHIIAIILCCAVVGVTYTWPTNIALVIAMLVVGCFSLVVGWRVANSMRTITALTRNTESLNLPLPVP